VFARYVWHSIASQSHLPAALGAMLLIRVAGWDGRDAAARAVLQILFAANYLLVLRALSLFCDESGHVLFLRAHRTRYSMRLVISGRWLTETIVRAIVLPRGLDEDKSRGFFLCAVASVVGFHSALFVLHDALILKAAVAGSLLLYLHSNATNRRSDVRCLIATYRRGAGQA
jgi:hypothetical protein